MKKLELNQMINVNGGDRCSRYMNRYNRMSERKTTEGRMRRMNKMLAKLAANCR